MMRLFLRQAALNARPSPRTPVAWSPVQVSRNARRNYHNVNRIVINASEQGVSLVQRVILRNPGHFEEDKGMLQPESEPKWQKSSAWSKKESRSEEEDPGEAAGWAFAVLLLGIFSIPFYFMIRDDIHARQKSTFDNEVLDLEARVTAIEQKFGVTAPSHGRVRQSYYDTNERYWINKQKGCSS